MLSEGGGNVTSASSSAQCINAFLQAFRRFTSQKSLPSVIISDNVTTYVAASNQLEKLCDSPVFQDDLSRRGTDRKIIPKRAPWYRILLERLTGLAKTSFKKILGQRLVYIHGNITDGRNGSWAVMKASYPPILKYRRFGAIYAVTFTLRLQDDATTISRPLPRRRC